MSRMRELQKYVQDSTVVFRKGDVIKADEHSITIDAFPEQPESKQTVDLHFVTVGFTEKAPVLTAQQFYDLIEASAEGDFGTMTTDRLKQGPSYIELGGWLGDQTLAFRFMALGQLHGLWEIVTPERMGIPEPAASQLAGSGFIMITGLKNPSVTVG